MTSQVYSLKANLIFNLSSVEKSLTASRATYDIYPIGEVPFNLLNYTQLQVIETVDPRNRSFKIYNIQIKMNDQVFNKTAVLHLFERNILDRSYYNCLRFDIRDVLDKIFKCQNYSGTYVSKFYYLGFEGDNISLEELMDPSHVYFIKIIKIFWLITKNSSLKYDNEINYQGFLDDCNQTSPNYVLLLLGLTLAIVLVGVGISYVHDIAQNRRIFPR